MRHWRATLEGVPPVELVAATWWEARVRALHAVEWRARGDVLPGPESPLLLVHELVRAEVPVVARSEKKRRRR
jgi:hypothetical protein